MHYRYLVSAIAILSVLPAIHAVEPSELKPGLVTTYFAAADGKAGAGTTVTRLEPTVALTLNAGETPHPRMSHTDVMTWKGYINVLRPGKYTFSAKILGGVIDVQVNGKAVLTSRLADVGHLTELTQEATLESGVQPFVATFKGATPCRVELFWQGPGFIKEPLPHQFLGHLPKDRPAQFAKDVQLEHGRFKFEELSCIRCHKPGANDAMAKGLVDHVGPNLTEVGKRDYAGWLDAWLADPSKLRPHTTMPKMFTDDAAGKAERYAVVKYLVSLSGQPLENFKPPVAPNEYRQSMDRGKVLFAVTGCAACHTDPQPKKPVRNDEEEKEPLAPEDSISGAGTLAGSSAKYNLGALGSKYRPETLAAFLQNPLKTHPSGRMPHMNLAASEAQDISRYLCRVTDDNIEPSLPTVPKGATPATIAKKVLNEAAVNQDEIAKYEKLNASAQWNYLGEKLLIVNGCVNCHTIEPGGKKLEAMAKMPSLDDIRKADAGKGCMADKPDVNEVPAYKFDAKEKAAIAAFLKTGLTGAGSPAPTYSARAALRRFNCLNCHSRDGEGGISAELANEMRLFEKAENADDIRPPLLTGIGHKVRTSWMKAVLTQSGRARPWMQLRMPQYGEANVGFLPEPLAAIEGTTPDDTIHKVQLSAEKISAGRTIVGKGGLGCISCHDIAGIANTGTRGPDLSTINQRVRYDWYERWLHQPLRMAPGTRMPQAFVDGKSTLATVMNGNPDSQADAMWAYLSLGPGLPLPEGLEPPKGLIIAVKNRPELLRTFLPEAGNKAIAIGYPGGISVAFSADQCRLTYAWAGNYLDASPVWNNRGGAPAKLLGPKFWSAPSGHPWGLTVNPNIPPDFMARANNPAYGMPLPLEPARIYDGPLAVGFDGYSLEADGTPTFRYHLTGNRESVLNVTETNVPLQTGVASGLHRRFQVSVPAGYRAWFLAGSTTKEPRLYGPGWSAMPFDSKKESVVASVDGLRIVLPGEGDKATLLRADRFPPGTQWRFVPKTGGGWLAIVQLPLSENVATHTLNLQILAAPKDDDDLLKGLGN